MQTSVSDNTSKSTLCVQPSGLYGLPPQQQPKPDPMFIHPNFRPISDVNGQTAVGNGGQGGFFFGQNNQDAAKNENKQLTADPSNEEQLQKKSVENNQLFAKILENEMFKVPMHFKLDCMQEMLGVVKKYTSTNKVV